MPMPMGWTRVLIDVEWLREQYCDKQLSTTDLAKLTGYSPSHIKRILNAHGIKTRTRAEGVKTQASRQKRSESMAGKMAGELNPMYVRGYCMSDGYYRNSGKRELQHRAKAAEMIGRPLEKDEVVHHINGNKTDNRPENLQVMKKSEHSTLHNNIRWGKEGI